MRRSMLAIGTGVFFLGLTGSAAAIPVTYEYEARVTSLLDPDGASDVEAGDLVRGTVHYRTDGWTEVTTIPGGELRSFFFAPGDAGVSLEAGGATWATDPGSGVAVGTIDDFSGTTFGFFDGLSVIGSEVLGPTAPHERDMLSFSFEVARPDLLTGEEIPATIALDDLLPDGRARVTLIADDLELTASLTRLERVREPEPQPIPEPGTLGLLGLAAAMVAARRRRP